MKVKEMSRLIKHFDLYFGQNDCTVLHPTVEAPLHIDALLYKPNDRYPYWKLISMGASDYKMPVKKPAFGNRNEYILFIHPDVDMSNPTIAAKYYRILVEVSLYPVTTKTYVTYGHSLEWQATENEETVGAYLELPQLVEDTGVLRCKLSLCKTAICLQIIPLNQEELTKLLEIGPQAFSYHLYPDEDDGYYLRRMDEKKDI